VRGAKKGKRNGHNIFGGTGDAANDCWAKRRFLALPGAKKLAPFGKKVRKNKTLHKNLDKSERYA
jgi:hypothetical protein